MSARRAERSGIRILVTVNFNDNQLRAHVLPILELPEVCDVTLVADRPVSPHPKLRVVIPPHWLSRICSRAVAKFVVTLALAIRSRFDWIMGFHFSPHGFTASLVGSLTRTKSLYHMIGGESEWGGGGFDSENRLLGRLGRPSPTLERIFVHRIKSCTAVAAMGENGRATFLKHGVDPARIWIIRPSVDTSRFALSQDGERRYDVVSVGRLAPRKRPGDLVSAVAALRLRRPGIRAAIVGEGAVEAELRGLAERLEVADAVELLGFRADVETIYAAARIFAMTSDSEGLPISMLEAMSAGVPCVLPAVGEIPAFVGDDGARGLLFSPGDVPALVAHLERLLEDDALRRRIGAAAAEKVRESASVEAVGQTYRELFERRGVAAAT